MQSSPPHSDGKARAIRELSASLNRSQRSISPVHPPPSDSNPTKRSGFGEDTLDFFDNEDVLMSTQHKIDEDTNTLPQYPRMRSTAKKINSWRPLHSEQPNPDTSMVNKMFHDFNSGSDGEDMSIEQARGNGGHRSNRSTPAKMKSRDFDSLYDITPPTNRSRKSYVAETGSLRRDAQIRRASRNDMDETASPRPASARKSFVGASNQERRRPSLAQLHAKVSEDESSFVEERPPTVTLPHSKNSRWGNTRPRQTSLQTDGVADGSPRVHATPRSRPATAQNATAQSFVLPDMPNLTELVSGMFEDGTPVFSKTVPARSRFAAPNNGGRRQPNHIPVDSVPIPQDEKAIFAALQLLQDKVSQMEHERAEAEKKMEEQELEIIELKATTQAQERLRRSDSALGSTDGEGSGKGTWRVEKTRLDATVQTLRTKLDRAERKTAVLDIEKKRLTTERDNLTSQLGVAFQTCEELKLEKEALRSENDALRQEIDSLRADNEMLRVQLEQEEAHYREETVQLRRQVDQTENATQRQNATLQNELARVRAQQDEHTQQLARKDIELRKARQEQAEYARLKAHHEALKSQLASLKAKREEDIRRWSSQEAALKSKVETRDETIRLFQDANQEQTNEAMRLDNEHLREELAQLAAQHEEDNQHWSRKESELKRKISQREEAAQHAVDMTQEVLSLRQANGQRRSAPAPASRDKENGYDEPVQHKSSYGREENTRTRIRNRVQEESRNSRANASFQSSNVEESPRKSYIKITRASQRTSLPADLSRSASAPISPRKIVEVDSDAESTTDISLAPRGTPYVMRGGASGRPSATTVQPPADLDLTELSFIDSAQIAQLRRQLEEERAAARGRAVSVPLERPTRDNTIQSERRTREDTVRSERQAREDTVRSVASAGSARRPSLPRKSSMKDATTRTNVTQFEEDVTGNVSNIDTANVDHTQTRQSAVDASLLSNTSRRRRSAPTEMTSAFIVPDIKIDTRKQSTVKIDTTQDIHSKHHDNDNCTYCRREAKSGSTDPLRVPKLLPVSSRMPDDVDATLRPSRSPKEALALVVKELQDERAHLHMELAVMRAMLESHDPSLGRKKRVQIQQAVSQLLAKIQTRDDQIYHLYDVLEGQQDHDITEQFIEDVTEQIRAEDAEIEKKSKEKKVTIQSFHEDEGEESAEDLPWEGFEDDTADRDFVGIGSRVGVY
ncbi:hypothetical protein K458DRAFT_356151 [Lentithecium fluviatile CBS 122367]|uniref:Cep57 centrosome microtubule-binding domain-containing protein n=1 Tax=Lentithecium fluviatile CBS 122367 TaxID=1168545 RepID=A0A6G1JGZ3_9PLEO|nr:hypothetical protein K458DRAFT_356151 [Lentithecium fluviatile CBS 122367]